MYSSNSNKNGLTTPLEFKSEECDMDQLNEREKTQIDSDIVDLSELKIRTEAELFNVLALMKKNKQYFRYCGSLLININPGPDYIWDYLNFKMWIKDTEYIPQKKWNPHLYSFINMVYQTMVNEKEDQVVHILGHAASGKTFNMIHIIEYLCYIAGDKANHNHIFNTLQKSIQLIHMLGSIFRGNNPESSSCGMLLRLGFGEDSLLQSFDIEAKILDYTLPFSSTGRSFTLLHSVINGASDSIKEKIDLPLKENKLNFFRKFNQHFSIKEKDDFRLNDIETWNRFHLLLKTFQFDKKEIKAILQMFSVIINLSDINLQLVRYLKKDNKDTYKITSDETVKKLIRALDIEEKAFIISTGTFTGESEAKKYVKSLMKYCYYMTFEYILQKIKDYLKTNFNQPNAYNQMNEQNDYWFQNREQNSQEPKFKTQKYINLIDFPGQVDDQTLGGFTTNIAYECLNLLSGSAYLGIVEKMFKEGINIKQFQPLHSFNIIRSIIGDKGVFDYLQSPLNKNNYYQMKEEFESRNPPFNCIQFAKSQNPKAINYNFQCCFSNKDIQYNFETLRNEALVFENAKKLVVLFEKCNNIVVSSTYKTVVNANSNFYSQFFNHLMKLLSPIENIKPFVVYNLHSDESYNMFLRKDNKREKSPEELPKDLTVKLLNHSLIMPVLHWEYYGYKEWMEIDTIITEYSSDLEKLQMYILSSRTVKTKYLPPNIVLKKTMNNVEKAKLTMNILSKEGDYLIGLKFILMRKGTLSRMRANLNLMIKDILESEKPTIRRSKKLKTNSKPLSRETNKSISKFNPNHGNPLKMKKDKAGSQLISSLPIPKEFWLVNADNASYKTLKEHFSIQIIENNYIINNTRANTMIRCENYNVFNFIDKSRKERKKSVLSVNYLNQEGIITMLTNTSQLNLLSERKFNTSASRTTHDGNSRKSIIQYSYNIKRFSKSDYEKYTIQIIILQKYFRFLLSKNKLRMLRYLNEKATMIQKHYRRLIAQIKFKRFSNCLNKIIFIQRKVKEWIVLTNLKNKKGKSGRKRRNGVYNERIRKSTKIGIEKRQGKEDRKYSYLDDPNREKVLSKEEIEKNKIIKEKARELIFDYKLLNQNSEFNISAINLKGIDKKLRKDIIEGTHRKRAMSQDYFNETNGRLIDNSKRKKQKRENNLREKYLAEEKNLTFIPKINQVTKYDPTLNGFTFMKRNEFYSLFKEKNLEASRIKNSQKEEKNLTFKPEITSLGKAIKRNLSNLYDLDEIQKKQNIKNSQKNTNSDDSDNKNKKMDHNIISRTQRMKGFNDANYSKNNNVNSINKNKSTTDINDIWPVDFKKQLYYKRKK